MLSTSFLTTVHDYIARYILYKFTEKPYVPSINFFFGGDKLVHTTIMPTYSDLIACSAINFSRTKSAYLEIFPFM